MSAVYDPIAAAALRQQFMAGVNGHHAEEEEAAAPVFPTDDLPAVWGEYVTACAAAIPTPPEMIALPMLVQVGALIGNRAVLELKRGWQEWLSLFGVVVAPSGGLKTPAFNAARAPFRQLQGNEAREYEGKVLLWEEDQARWESANKNTRGTEPQEPVMRDYFTTDSTMESLAPLLKHTPGIVYDADEIVTWVERMNQYRKGGDRQQYMSIHSGQAIKTTRKGSATIYVEHPVVGVFGGIQPDILPALRGDVKGDDGFIYRYLPIIPHLQPKQWNDNEIGQRETAGVAALMRDVDAMPFAVDGVPLTVRLSKDAVRVFAAWSDHNNLEAWRLGGALRGFYVKLEAHVARFVLILHVTSEPTGFRRDVDAETVHRAIRLGEFFREQIHHFIPLMGIGSGEGSRAIGLASRIRKYLQLAASEVSMSTVNDGKNEHLTFEVSMSTVNDGKNAPNEGGWVSFRDVQRGVGSPNKEYVLKELDTYIDSSDVVTRTASYRGGERQEYRWSERFGHMDTLTLTPRMSSVLWDEE